MVTVFVGLLVTNAHHEIACGALAAGRFTIPATTWLLVPLNESALPCLPVTQVTLVSVPVFPFPDASAVVVPVPSLNAYAATAVNVVALDVVALAIAEYGPSSPPHPPRARDSDRPSRRSGPHCRSSFPPESPLARSSCSSPWHRSTR